MPTSAPPRAAEAWSAEVSTTGMPAPVAIRAASTLVTMPPVPTPAAPGEPMVTGSRSAAERTVGHQARARPARRAVVQAVDVGEQDQQVGVHEVGDERREAVVVTEADLRGGDRVVLVDDRQHAELEELGEGLVGVAVVRAPDDVLDGQQHLPGDEPVAGELLLVAVRQQPLADAGRRLLGGQRPAAAGSAPAEPGRPRSRRTRRARPRRRGRGPRRARRRAAGSGRGRSPRPRWSATTSRP